MNEGLVEKSRTVGVVLVNWNGAEYTIPCIESLLAGSLRPDHIIVVDNASQDGSADRIAERFPGIELIRNSENMGFTGANNIGISRLMTSGCSYIWILNNDTTVDRACLEVLKAHMDTHADTAACSGKILFAEPADILWYAGATYNRWTIRTRHRGHGKRDVGQYERIEPVPFISGCCMFVRREAIESIGTFDNHFFAYGEDSDWCLRAEKAKLRLEYVSRAVIRHKVSASLRKLKNQNHAGDTSPFAVYIVSRNKLYLIRKHGRNLFLTGTALLMFAIWICYYGSVLFAMWRINKLTALLMACYDGLAEPLEQESVNSIRPRYLIS